jgi:hypothetical protein
MVRRQVVVIMKESDIMGIVERAVASIRKAV